MPSTEMMRVVALSICLKYAVSLTTYACENSMLTLECDDHDKVLHVTYAAYSRLFSIFCNTGDTRTCATGRDALSEVGNLCNGRQSCQVSVKNNLVGDPCSGKMKYLRVTYGCVYTGCGRHQEYVINKGSRLQNHEIGSNPARNFLSCESRCNDDLTCLSFNWNGQSSVCETSESTRDASTPGDFVSDNEWLYLEKHEDSFCDVGETSFEECTRTGRRTGCKGCMNPIGIEDDLIPDDQISATTYTGESWRPHAARLNHDTAWSTHTVNQNQYIQVVLNHQQYITGVITQGRLGHWVTHYKVEYSPNDIDWEFVTHPVDGTPKVFAGNTDSDTAVTNMFPRPIIATIVRLRPTAWHPSWIHVRMEWLGCLL